MRAGRERNRPQEGANIGCGTITANYDGIRKNKTLIGDGVKVGSGTVFVAPVRVGDRAMTGANSVILKDIGADETAVGVPARILERKVAR